MQTKWLISEMGGTTYQDGCDALKNALKRQGIEYKIAEDDHFLSETTYLNLFRPEDCVVFIGSLEFAEKVKAAAKRVPGVYHNVPAFECTYYYPRLGQYLLNDNYIMIPYGELLRQKEFLYEHVGNQDVVFIRPNTGSKLFTGRPVYREHYEKDVERTLGFYDVQPEALVVVAEPQNLDGEWRFIAVEGRIVTGSQYRNKLGPKIHEDYPQEAFDLASEIASKFQPDPVYCVDICYREHYNDYRLLEVGCFSCAGLYACDKDVIAEEVSQLAWKEWKEKK